MPGAEEGKSGVTREHPVHGTSEGTTYPSFRYKDQRFDTAIPGAVGVGVVGRNGPRLAIAGRPSGPGRNAVLVGGGLMPSIPSARPRIIEVVRLRCLQSRTEPKLPNRRRCLGGLITLRIASRMRDWVLPVGYTPNGWS